MTIPDGFRELANTEITKDGDLFLNIHNNSWMPVIEVGKVAGMEHVVIRRIQNITTTQNQKEIFIKDQMEKFWIFCEQSMVKYQEREHWICENFAYNDSGAVIPESIQVFSNAFLRNLTDLVKEL